jgi:dolichol-phosphate mannosyltransferase
LLETKDILLAIANYNQIHEIKSFLPDVLKYWDKKHLVVVDDGSNDGSQDYPATLGLQTLRHSQNIGVGAAIRTAILHAHTNNYKAILVMSSNGKMKPVEIERLIKPVLEDAADYTTGSRFIRGGESPGLTSFRRAMIPVFSFLASIALFRNFSDITCGFRCYKIDFLFNGSCDINQVWLNRYEMEYYIHFWACKMKLKIQEVPVTIRYDHLKKNRFSKIRPVVDWWSMMKPLLYLRLGLKR